LNQWQKRHKDFWEKHLQNLKFKKKSKKKSIASKKSTTAFEKKTQTHSYFVPPKKNQPESTTTIIEHIIDSDENVQQTIFDIDYLKSTQDQNPSKEIVFKNVPPKQITTKSGVLTNIQNNVQSKSSQTEKNKFENHKPNLNEKTQNQNKKPVLESRKELPTTKLANQKLVPATKSKILPTVPKTPKLLTKIRSNNAKFV